MKDNLFELLLHLFEQSLVQLQKDHLALNSDPLELIGEEDILKVEDEELQNMAPYSKATRIFTYEEQMKLTKASYQFLMRMKLWKVIDEVFFETVMHQLLFSDSNIITLEETKWTIRQVLAPQLNEHQLAFLDLVLYQKEDKLPVH